MKTLIVGDVHGCGKELATLIEDANPDRVILVGDVFDRAPHGVDVWRIVQQDSVSMLMGNHEAKFLDFFNGKKQYLPRHYYQFLNNYLLAGFKLGDFYDFLTKLPTLIKLSNDACVVHAGACFATPLKPDYSMNVYGGYLSDQRKLRDRSKDDWSKAYEESNNTCMVYFGHVAYSDIHRSKNSICLDTSACHGGKLSGIIHETQEVYQVRCPDYFTKSKKTEVIPDPRIEQFKISLTYGKV